MDVYPYGSVVAFNLWGAIHGFWVKDTALWFGLPLYVYGATATGAVLIAVAVWAGRRGTTRALMLAGAVALLATFVLPTRIHERYLLPAIPFLAVAAMIDRRMLWPYGWLSLTLLLNLLYAYTRPYVETFALPGWLETTVFSDPGTRVLSALCVAAFAIAAAVLFTHREGDTAGGILE
jgi:hypothetical protein